MIINTLLSALGGGVFGSIQNFLASRTEAKKDIAIAKIQSEERRAIATEISKRDSNSLTASLGQSEVDKYKAFAEASTAQTAVTQDPKLGLLAGISNFIVTTTRPFVTYSLLGADILINLKLLAMEVVSTQQLGLYEDIHICLTGTISYWFVTRSFEKRINRTGTPIQRPTVLSNPSKSTLCKKILPRVLVESFEEALEKYDISDDVEICHLLAQVSHESGGFKHTEENLNYSSKALRSVFGKYYKTRELANQEERKPELIANRVYGGRLGNDNPGDGWKYRGRGFIQLTGKDNYTEFSQNFFGDNRAVDNPEIVKEMSVSINSCVWFWSKNITCNKNSTVREITKLVNGGYNGLMERRRLFNKFKKLIDD